MEKLQGTAQEAIDIVKATGLDLGGQMEFLLSLTDTEKVMNDLKKSAVMARVGMGEIRPTDIFTYSVLSIWRPELFESKEGEQNGREEDKGM